MGEHLPDADQNLLQQIADATGGSFYAVRADPLMEGAAPVPLPSPAGAAAEPGSPTP